MCIRDSRETSRCNANDKDRHRKPPWRTTTSRALHDFRRWPPVCGLMGRVWTQEKRKDRDGEDGRRNDGESNQALDHECRERSSKGGISNQPVRASSSTFATEATGDMQDDNGQRHEPYAPLGRKHLEQVIVGAGRCPVALDPPEFSGALVLECQREVIGPAPEKSVLSKHSKRPFPHFRPCAHSAEVSRPAGNRFPPVRKENGRDCEEAEHSC